MPDVIHFAERIVLPSEPETIVFLPDDNDIAAGAWPKHARGDEQIFVDVFHAPQLC